MDDTVPLPDFLIATETCRYVNFLSTCDGNRVSTNGVHLIRSEFAHGRNFVLAYFLSSSRASPRTRAPLAGCRCHVHVPSRMFVLTSNARLIVFRGRGVLNLQEYHVTFVPRYSRKRSENISISFLPLFSPLFSERTWRDVGENWNDSDCLEDSSWLFFRYIPSKDTV